MLSISKDKLDPVTIVVKKSKFISYAFRVDDVEKVGFYLDKLKEKYSDSSHICYAYKINEFEKAYDNGEPQGTAGKPILNLIKQKGFNLVLVAVIRYFGGTLLGANGLVHAYSDACNLILEKAKKVQLEIGVVYNVKVVYDEAFKIYVLSNTGLFKIESRIGNEFVLSSSEDCLSGVLRELNKINVISLNYQKNFKEK